MAERWEQRFQNFEKAYTLLKEIAEPGFSNLSDLEKEGGVQRFEYTYKLAWKTLKDYLEYTGIEIESETPRDTFKKGVETKILKDGQVWVSMIKDRNLTTHTYNESTVSEIVEKIETLYFPALKQLYDFLKDKHS